MSKSNNKKICKDCGKEKFCFEFYHLENSRRNIATYCLDCKNERDKINLNKMELFNNGFKICFKCKEKKELFNFHNNKHGYDGKNCYCKPCTKKNNSTYPVNLELKKVNKQRYRFKNREFINQRQNEKFKSKKFKSMANTANRLSREKSTGEQITKWDLWKLAKKQKLCCAISGVKLNNDTISLDHILPFSRGGLNQIENIQLVHNSINLMKGSFLIEDFIKTIETIYLYQKSK